MKRNLDPASPGQRGDAVRRAPKGATVTTQLQQVPCIPLNAAADTDYVDTIQAINAKNLEMRRHGPTAERLLSKAFLELAVRNYDSAFNAAVDALAVSNTPEGHYLAGLTSFHLALFKYGFITAGPGHIEQVKLAAMDYVKNASWEFGRAVEERADDEEANAALAFVDAALKHSATEDGLRRFLAKYYGAGAGP